MNLELWYRTFIDGNGIQTLPTPGRLAKAAGDGGRAPTTATAAGAGFSQSITETVVGAGFSRPAGDDEQPHATA
jgi:hypothetical protein